MLVVGVAFGSVEREYALFQLFPHSIGILTDYLLPPSVRRRSNPTTIPLILALVLPLLCPTDNTDATSHK